MQFQSSAQCAAVEMTVVHEGLVEVDGKRAVVQILVRVAHGEVDGEGWHHLMVNLELVHPRECQVNPPIIREMTIAKITSDINLKPDNMSSHLRLKLVSEEEVEVAVLGENRWNGELILLEFLASLFVNAAKTKS